MPKAASAASAATASAPSLLTICYLACLCSFGSLVNDLYLPALPAMRAEFHASASTVQLGLSFGMLGLGFGELYWGALSDKIGRKPVLYLSITLFVLSALASIFAPTMSFFLACRLVQGLGASGAILLSRTIPTDNFQGEQLARIMALVGAINGIAPGGGPILGGFLAESIGWRGIFALLALYALVIIAFGTRLKESLPKSRRRQGPLLDTFCEYPPLLRNRRFMAAVLLKGAALGTLFAYVSAAPFIIEEHYGYSPSSFGLLMGANALAIMLGSMCSLRFGSRVKVAAGGAMGLALFAFAEAWALCFIDSLLIFECLILPMLFASGLIFAAANTLAMGEGREAAGAASAILGLAGYLFGCIVSPLVGLGNILHSTAIALCLCALVTLFYAWRTFSLGRASQG